MTEMTVYSTLTRQMDYPIGLKTFILFNTDYLSNKTKRVSRFVSTIEMFEGKPLKRIFGFLSTSPNKTLENMKVREVARYYDRKQYLGYVYSNYVNGNKVVNYEPRVDHFVEYKNNNRNWTWYATPMESAEDVLIKLKLPYTGWDGNPELEFFDFLERYIENPKVELLMKAGYGKWVPYIKYLNTNAKSLSEIFKINQDCVPLLQVEGFGFKDLMCCRKYGYNNINDIAAQLAIDDIQRFYKRNRNGDNELIIEILKARETFKYLVKLHSKYKHFYFNDYLDYLQDLEKVGGLTDHKALYPKSFKKEHQKLSQEIQIAQDSEKIKGFEKNYKKHKKYEFSNDEYLIRPVKEPKELHTESEKLHHCVRGYVDDVAECETEIFFIRKVSQPDKPFYTLELQKKKIIQIRGKHNCDPNRNVKQFVIEWAKKFRFNKKNIGGIDE